MNCSLHPPLDVRVYMTLSIDMAAVPRDSGGVTSSENNELGEKGT